VPLGFDVATCQRGLGDRRLVRFGADVDAVRLLIEKAEQSGRLDERRGPDAELG
jgi:hypothetical protein